MAKYLLRGSYSPQGNAGIVKGGGGSARRKAIAALFEGVGGKVEAFYWALGKDDFILIVEVPDMVTLAAIAMQVGSSGAVSRLESTALLSADDVDAAVRKSVKYTPPGQ